VRGRNTTADREQARQRSLKEPAGAAKVGQQFRLEKQSRQAAKGCTTVSQKLQPEGKIKPLRTVCEKGGQTTSIGDSQTKMGRDVGTSKRQIPGLGRERQASAERASASTSGQESSSGAFRRRGGMELQRPTDQQHLVGGGEIILHEKKGRGAYNSAPEGVTGGDEGGGERRLGSGEGRA